uniref:Uncharacterized protein n=1 Tax=Daphnia galeata TaxID=27404 RepID=A0A8J2RSX1_9CRUS|nr:unnamed protein product [Daphnia galeata]
MAMDELLQPFRLLDGFRTYPLLSLFHLSNLYCFSLLVELLSGGHLLVSSAQLMAAFPSCWIGAGEKIESMMAVFHCGIISVVNKRRRQQNFKMEFFNSCATI